MCCRLRCVCVFFFFSSRRRHTRFDCDWSSDVCSSDLFWFVGLPVALYNAGSTPTGFSLGYGYEAENFRISVTGAGYSRGGDGVGYLVMEAAWIPFATEVSPYIGGGFGYMGAGGHGGLGGVVEGGLAAFRLHGVRGLIGVQLTIPFFDTPGSSPPLT